MHKYTKLAAFLGGIVTLAILIFIISSYSVKRSEIKPPGEAMENDANERLQWELRRLAAPDGKIPDNMRSKELAFASTLPVKEVDPSNHSQFTGWVERGPWNVGGRTRALGVDKLNENNLLAGTCSGAMWRSSDGGAYLEKRFA